MTEGAADRATRSRAPTEMRRPRSKWASSTHCTTSPSRWSGWYSRSRRSRGHRRLDFLEIGFADLEEPSPEDHAPTLFVANELELFDQRLNGDFAGGEEFHLTQPHVINFDRRFIDHFADGRESLVGSRRVEDDAIAFREPLQPPVFPVIGLSESAGDAVLHVSTRECIDEISHAPRFPRNPGAMQIFYAV